jgi:hypothetical protein
MSTTENPLVVVQSKENDALAIATKKIDSLSRLFQLKPSILELVSKSTRQEGAKPGTFRVTSTNESFESMRVVVLFEPVEQREKYRKGEYTKESKLCFSLDNYKPHAKAKEPPAMYCSTCPDGERIVNGVSLAWEAWRKAKAQGLSGDQLAAFMPKCRKFWHLFLASRETRMPYYFNVKGTSVKNFEDGMQNMARIFQMMVQNIKVENTAIESYNNTTTEEKKPLIPMPLGVGDLIYKVSFTMYPFQVAGGPFQVGFKDFKMMDPKDQAEFGKILEDFTARRNAGNIQSQESAEQEAEATAAVTEKPAASATAGPVTTEVAKQNAQIQI